MCKDKRVRHLAIKYVVVKDKKKDIALGQKGSCFSVWSIRGVGHLTHCSITNLINQIEVCYAIRRLLSLNLKVHITDKYFWI